MTTWEWGKTRPSVQLRRVTDAEARLARQLEELEIARAAYEVRRSDVAELRAQIDRYFDAVAAKKLQADLGIEAKAMALPTRLDFICKSIIAERIHRGEAAWSGFDVEGPRILEIIAGLTLEQGVAHVLPLLDWNGGHPPEDLEAVVIADVGFCEMLMEEAVRTGGAAVSRALSQIEKHFEVFEALDPVFGLPEEKWRPIVEAWKAEFSIPENVVRDAGRNVFRGQKPGLVLSMSLMRRFDIDPETGVAVSMAFVLNERLRAAAGRKISLVIDAERDPLDGFLDQARKAVKRAEGTRDEAAQRRLLAGLEEVAPFALAPGAAEAAKRARDIYPGRFFGEMPKLEIPWSLEDRRVYGILSQGAARRFSFGNIGFDEEGMEKRRALAAKFVSEAPKS